MTKEQPTEKQLLARRKYAKIKELTNKGEHVEASKLYNTELEELDALFDAIMGLSIYKKGDVLN